MRSNDRLWILHVWEGDRSVPILNQHGNAAFCGAQSRGDAEAMFCDRYSDQIGDKTIRVIEVPR